MCGRFALGLPRQNIVQAVRDAHPDLDLGDWIEEEEFHPRYNIAPRSQSPVIRRRNRYDDDATENQDHPEVRAVVHTMKWGLIPHWSKHEDKTLNTINAKAENLVEGGGMWGSIKGKKRCAVLCQGYYEWLKKGKEKVPHFTKNKDGKLLFLAGLYDSVTLEGETKPLWTFTIVTTDANKQLSWLHDRMPVILSTKAQLISWLDTSSGAWSATLSKICLPYNNKSRPLVCYAVPLDVGKVGTESPTFIEPIANRKDGIQAMFAKQSGKKASEEPPKPSSSTGETLKRKRELPELKQVPSIELLDGPPEEKKARKTANTDDSDIDTLGDGNSKVKDDFQTSDANTKLSTNSSKPRSRGTKAPQKSPARNKANPHASPSNSKITTFFTKDK